MAAVSGHVHLHRAKGHAHRPIAEKRRLGRSAQAGTVHALRADEVIGHLPAQSRGITSLQVVLRRSNDLPQAFLGRRARTTVECESARNQPETTA
jgi:hypothetical protein